MRTEIVDMLRAAGLTVARGNRAKGVIVEARGEGVCELRFRPERPASLPHGLPWDADLDACRLIARAVQALLGHFTIKAEGRGRATVVLVSRREGQVAA